MEQINRRHKMSCRQRRKCSNWHLAFLSLFFGISSVMISVQAAPHPKAQAADEDFRRNYAVEYGAPLISPLREYVMLDVNSKYTIRCEANQPIVWKMPHSVQSHEAAPFDTLDPKRPYGSELHLTDITYQNVGSYYCVKEPELKKPITDMEDSEFVELVNDNLASTIYVYVNDPENLLAPQDSPLITAYQYQDTVIPCKPTMPTVDVLLTTPHGDENEQVNVLSSSRLPPQLTSFPPDNVYKSIEYKEKTFSSENTGRYDPQRGFVVEIRGIPDSGSYMCRPKIPSAQQEEEELTFEIHFVGNEPITQLDKTPVEATTPTTTTIKPNKKLPRTTPPANTKTATTKTKTTTSATNSTKSTVTNNIVNVTNRIVDLTTAAIVNTIDVDTDVDVGGMVDDKVGVGINVGVTNGADLSNMEYDDHNDNDNDSNVDDGDQLHKTTVAFGVRDDYKIPNRNVAATTARAATTTANSGETADSAVGEAANDNNNDVDVDVDVDVDDEGDDNVDALETLTSASVAHYARTRRVLIKRASARTTASHRPYSNHFRSTPRTSTKYIEKPIITSTSNGHAYEGDHFSLNCFVKTAFDVNYEATWKTPPGVEESRIKKTRPGFYNSTDTHNLGVSVLTVSNAQKSDSGLYECIATDHSNNIGRNTYLMTILSPGEGYINISEPSGYYNIIANANKKVQINVKYRGFPMPTLTWYKPGKREIHNSAKYIISTTDTSTTLQILDAQLEDSGEYVINATNDLHTKELQFNVSINDVPKVAVADVYVQAGEEAHVICTVLSYPTATVSWEFLPCSTKPRWPACDNNIKRKFNSTGNVPGQRYRSIEYLHELHFTPDSPGIIHCLATNKRGNTSGTGHVLISDIGGNMTVYGIDEDKKIARGDEVQITCAVLTYYFNGKLSWYKDDEPVRESSDIQIISSTSNYSYKKTLKFKDIKDEDRGDYKCLAEITRDNYDSKSTYIFVHEPLAPRMISSNLDSTTKLSRKMGEPLELECEAEAIPIPNIDWYKDDVKLNTTDNLEIIEDGKKLYVKYMKPEDDGVYKCVAANRLGVVERSAKVEITNLPGLALGWILSIVAFFVILVALVIYLIVRVRRERELLRELKAAGLANFEEGAVEHINPALTLDEQADLLPYDRGFEFPREKLKLGKQLGAGAFGVVLKAHAEGIKPEEKETVVAVKMVKRTADNEVVRALVSELKIMVHLGQHLNVVNLLGAVTKNIAKRELMVIVEYCRYGNVQNFLLKNRKRFINQVSPETDRIDPTIKTQRFSDNFELNRDGVKYVNLSFTNHQYVNHMNNMNNNYTMHNRRNSDNDPRSGTRAGRPNSTGYLRHSDLYEGHVDSCATEQTVMTTIPEDEDNILSNNSVQPAWRSNYKSDSTEAMTITTTDLVSWAFQVARGMYYLSSRKVLHGDLAARNILLCEDNVVKICDFGLARSMYKSDNYKKQGEAPLPIKWLALESLSDHVFSTYTDVWSFGIVLWEFFSLAKVPYPGMDPNQSLYLKLKDGYRMEKPPFANDELYDIMLECWSTNPESRPLFNVLEKRFARMLGDDVTNHYVDLNETYLRTSAEYMKRNPTDYLALMGSPDEVAPPPPRYVNGHILPEIRIDPSSSDDYLQMSTNTGTAIFSPTRPKDPNSTTDDPNTATTTSFTFPDSAPQQHSPTLVNNLDSPVSKNRRKEGIQPEEIPMLHSAHQNSDEEPSPEQARKFANMLQQARSTPTPSPSPRHHIAETELTGDDNYVNVKSPKRSLNNNGGRPPDAFSNPSYQILKTVNKEGGAGDK